jgi:hypothetical protein
MISKKKVAASLAGVASMFLIAGTSLSAMSASAAGAGACVVTGGAVTITGGGGITLQVPHNDTFSFVGLTINCNGSDSDDNGNWTIQASGHSDAETCASGSGGGTIDGGTSPSGAAGDGAVKTGGAGGSFTFTRAGSHVHVTNGTINTANGETHSFTAEFEFTPTDGECHGSLGTPTTHAGLQGAAAVTE